MRIAGSASGTYFSVAKGAGLQIYCCARFPSSIRRGGIALARSALDRLATVACFAILALGFTACSTVSSASRAESAGYVGPPRTIEAALPPNGEIAARPTATSPDADLTLLAARPVA